MKLCKVVMYIIPKLWHLEVRQENGHYVTACGLRYGIAGSAFKGTVSAGVCAKCLKRVSPLISLDPATGRHLCAVARRKW